MVHHRRCRSSMRVACGKPRASKRPPSAATVNYGASDCNFIKACRINSRRTSFSLSGGNLASPTTWTMPLPSTTRLAPTILATGNAAVICTVGMPAFSNSVVIAAPLRVLVPHVEVRITASMPHCCAFAAISRPMRRVFDNGLDKPDVAMNSSCSAPMTPAFSSSRMTSRGTKRSGS